jgi:hypothetical protein
MEAEAILGERGQVHKWMSVFFSVLSYVDPPSLPPSFAQHPTAPSSYTPQSLPDSQPLWCPLGLVYRRWLVKLRGWIDSGALK